MIVMSHSRIASVLTLAGSLLMIAGCGHNDPAGPDKPPEPKDYAIFFSCLGSPTGVPPNSVFRFTTQSEKFDTFSLGATRADRYEDVTVSAHGDRLYVGGRGINVRVYTTDSLLLLAVLPYTGTAVVSADNRFVAIVGGTLNVLKVTDFSLYYRDTSSYMSGSFSCDGESFYGAGTTVRHIRLRDSTIVGEKSFSGAIPMQMVPSNDGQKYFLYRMWTNDHFTFDVYEIARDSITYTLPLTPGYGSMTLAPNGRYLFITNPGNRLML